MCSRVQMHIPKLSAKSAEKLTDVTRLKLNGVDHKTELRAAPPTTNQKLRNQHAKYRQQTSVRQQVFN